MAEVPAPIGIFDSGIGGLTVFAKIAEALPHESMLYLGDTARVPYGTKSRETVIEYARGCSEVLLDRGVKLLVIACNTASAFAVDILREELPIPVLGVVEPGARAALRESRTGRIGVIGTPATIGSDIYARTILGMNPEAQVFSQACPLFVPLAEEGWTSGDIAEAVARRYLAPMLDHAIDVLVLGCTHYPLLAATIQSVVGPEVTLVDSASETACDVADLLPHPCESGHGGEHAFLVTDAPDRFEAAGGAFLGHAIHNISWINLNACRTKVN